MSKRPNAHPAQRLDLNDYLFAVRDFPSALRNQVFKHVLGSGVLEGFQCRVLDQVGSEIGHVEIFNGFGADHQGQFVNAGNGTNSVRVVLDSPNTEYWIEAELFLQPSDPDARAFWDALINNTAPIPDGQEVNVPNVMTRATPLWRIVRPIRQNTVGVRTDPSYAPAHFSPSDEFTLPLYILRTDANGRILAGNPDTDSTGNDIVTVTTGLGARQFIKSAGYGEPILSTTPGVFAKKMSDQRMRVFERRHFPFSFGDTNEVNGDTRSDHWVRDVPSAINALQTAVLEIKEGYSATNSLYLGNFNNTVFSGFGPNLTYVDLSDVQDTNSVTMTAEADKFINCTFEMTSGNWKGFTAVVTGNDRTGAITSGVTRVYLANPSSDPIVWKDAPAVGATCRIVNHRSKNWTDAPTPSTSNRGLNALDTEVYDARTDNHIAKAAVTLAGRVNANKFQYFSMQPGSISVLIPGGRAADYTLDPADATPALTIAAINSLFTQSTDPIEGGRVLFRTGLYDLDVFNTSGTVFNLDTVDGFHFQGEGYENTILDFDVNANTNNIFKFTNCRNITISDLTIRGTGQLMDFVGTNINIQLIRCKIVSAFGALTDPTINFGSTSRLVIRDCQIQCSGTGLTWTSMGNNTTIQGNAISTQDFGSAVKCKYLLYASTNATESGISITDNHMQGILSTNGCALHLANSTNTKIQGNTFQISTTGTSPGGSIIYFGAVADSVIFSNNTIEPNSPSDFTVPRAIDAGAATRCIITGNVFRSIINPIALNGGSYNNLNGNIFYAPPSSTGTAIDCSISQRFVISGNTIYNYLIGIQVSDTNEATVTGNQLYGTNAGSAIDVSDSIGVAINVCISGNQINTFANGILADNSNNLQIIGNNVMDCDTGLKLGTITSSAIQSNNVHNASLRGYDLRSASGNMISGNRCMYTGAAPSAGCYDLTGATNNAASHMFPLFGSIPTVLPGPGAISLSADFVNDVTGGNFVIYHNLSKLP